MARAIILVLDSFGVGYANDASKFGDVNANTFINIAKRYYKETQQVINLPNLGALGLHALSEQSSSETVWKEYKQLLSDSNIAFNNFYITPKKGAYGYMSELSTGKDLSLIHI